MRTSWAAAAACGLVLAACGSGDGSGTARRGPSDPADPAQVAELRAAVHSFWEDILTGQGPNAYTWLSARCQTIVDIEQFSDVVIRFGNGYAGPPLPFTTFSARIDGVHAKVDYTFRVHRLDELDDRWVLDSDGWRWDSCDHPPHHPEEGTNV